MMISLSYDAADNDDNGGGKDGTEGADGDVEDQMQHRARERGERGSEEKARRRPYDLPTTYGHVHPFDQREH